jgi:hypothetical protein
MRPVRPLPAARALAALVALLAAPAARALGAGAGQSDVSDELVLGVGPAAPQQPRTGSLSNAVAANLALDQALTLRLAADGTWVMPTSSSTAGRLGSRGALAWLFAAGLDWDPTPHWSGSLGVSLSPRSSLVADFRVPFSRALAAAVARTFAEAALESRSSSLGADLAVGWDSGDGAYETSVEARVAVTSFDVQQRIAEVRYQDQVLEPAEVAAFCGTHRCSQQARALLRGTADGLVQAEFGLAASETFPSETTVELSGSAFVYDKDPTRIGFYSLLAAARDLPAGGGLPLAPVAWTLRPRVEQRLGIVRVAAWYEREAYVSGEGHGDRLGARVTVRLGPAWRVWASATAERDVDEAGEALGFYTAGLGVRYRF